MLIACQGGESPQDDLTGSSVLPSPAAKDEPKPGPFLTATGCTAREAVPAYGTIGIFIGGTKPELYDCPGVDAANLKTAMRDYRNALRRGVRGTAIVSENYLWRHYLGTVRYCDQTIYSHYQGDVLMGVDTVWYDSTCVLVSYYWDEWVTFYSGDDIPEPYPTGGGPFYSPEDSLQRTPTIDTIASLDHLCEHLDSLKRKENANCVIPLDESTEALILDSLDQYLKPLSTITDTLQRRECDSLQTWFTLAVAYHRNEAPLFFAGRTDSLAPGKAPHAGQSILRPSGYPTPLSLHLDPKTIAKKKNTFGKKFILLTLLHEIGHSWKGIDHADPPADLYGFPDDPYYRTLHAAGACIQ